MKILSIVEDGDFIRVLTNYGSRPEFVYPVGRFASLVKLELEINKSILFEAVRWSKRLSDSNNLINDFVKYKSDIDGDVKDA